MRALRWLLACATLSVLGACASAPPPPAPRSLFNDALFRAPAARVSTDEVFAVSDAMRRIRPSKVGATIASAIAGRSASGIGSVSPAMAIPMRSLAARPKPCRVPGCRVRGSARPTASGRSCARTERTSARMAP